MQHDCKNDLKNNHLVWLTYWFFDLLKTSAYNPKRLPAVLHHIEDVDVNMGLVKNIDAFGNDKIDTRTLCNKIFSFLLFILSTIKVVLEKSKKLICFKKWFKTCRIVAKFWNFFFFFVFRMSFLLGWCRRWNQLWDKTGTVLAYNLLVQFYYIFI